MYIYMHIHIVASFLCRRQSHIALLGVQNLVFSVEGVEAEVQGAGCRL
jgi:hypothetical protein